MPRKAGFLHNDETRAKIKGAAIINRLMAHIESEKPIMDASQVNAAKALLSKVLPDLSSVDLSGELKHEVGAELKALLESVNGRTRGIPKSS